MTAAFRDRAVALGDALVLADLHLGKGADANVELPLGEREDLTTRVAALLDRYDPGTVVFAGDVLHSFDRVPTRARGTLSALVDLVAGAGADVVVTPGNHDTMLETLWDGPTPAEYDLGTRALPGREDARGRVVVCHGHVPPATDADCYVVGHVHPTITIEGRKWHCYLHGRAVYEGADVLVLPAFTRLVEGVSINRLRGGGTAVPNSPLVTDLDAFRPVVYDGDAEETRVFPPLGEFRDLL